MPAALFPKSDVIARITQTFKTHGYEGASLAELSQQTGLVKASLYHYFPAGKKQMAEAALDAFGLSMTEKVIAPLLSEASPRQRLLAMVDGLNAVYDGGSDLCLFALLSVGDTRELFQAKITATVGQLTEALTKTLREAGLSRAQAASRAEQLIVEIEGALVVSRVLGDAGVFQRTLKRLREQVA
jgi:TetR/AcrR family transcriptional regulator, lmrAB and yxaGH operons repressor